MSDAVLNRYTSDSWSLELSGEASPLSRWTRKPVVKGEHFRLSLLGFETGAAPISWLEGDRPLLEDLHRTVESYVQSNLQKPSRNPFAAGAAASEGMAVLDPLSRSDRSEAASTQIASTGSGQGSTASGTFQLKSDGSVAHRLHYHPVGTQARTLKLSTLQLADLLEVLDRWQAESMALPEEASGSTSTLPMTDFVIPAWGRVAASALIALGVAAGGISILMLRPNAQVASSDSESSVESAEVDAVDGFGAFPQVSSNPSGQLPNAPVPNSSTFSAPFLKQKPAGQRFGDISEQSLPGLESGDVATPSPGIVIPNPRLPNDSSAIASGIIDPTITSSSADASSIIEPSAIDPGIVDSTAIIAAADDFSDLPESDLGLPDNSDDLSIPAETPIVPSAPPVSSVPPAEPAPVIASTPTPSVQPETSFSDAESVLAAAEAEANLGGQSQAAKISSFPVETGSASASDITVDASTEAASGTPESATTAAPTIVENEVALSENVQPADTPSATAARSRGETISEVPAAPVATAAPTPTVQATSLKPAPTGEIQSSAVKSYFESRWEPPSDLDQSLQYQLIVSNEGSIERMNPLSPAATKYAEQAGIPSVGEPFIPASTQIQNATLVLTLGEDGAVNVSVQQVTPK